MTTEVAAPTCEARVGFYPGEWREMPTWCSATVGLTTWTDRSGFVHRACRHHLAPLQARYPKDETPRCYFCSRDVSDGLFRRFDFGKGGIQLVCDICDERADDGPYNTAAGHEHWDES